MYTKRVIADADPDDPTAPKLLAAGGAGAIGTGRAYVWKGDYLVELQYINEQETPDELSKSSSSILALLGKEIGAQVTGTTEKPASAKALPEIPNLISNGIQFYPKSLPALPELGTGAIGFYKGEKGERYRLLASVKDNVEQAKSVMKSLRARPGALPMSGVGDEAVQVVLDEGGERPKIDCILARKGAAIEGISDEEFVVKGKADKNGRLTKEEKVARLKSWFASVPPSASFAAPASSVVVKVPKK